MTISFSSGSRDFRSFELGEVGEDSGLELGELSWRLLLWLFDVVVSFWELFSGLGVGCVGVGGGSYPGRISSSVLACCFVRFLFLVSWKVTLTVTSSNSLEVS